MDEDAHLCLRCRATIVGLDNYVAHRQAGCSRNTAHEGKLDTDASVADEEVKTYAKQDLQEVKESKKLSDIPYPPDTHSLAHGTDGATTQESSRTAMTHRQEIVSTSKYSSSDASIRDCYVDQSGQTSEDQRPVAANTSSIHESYTVMEDFTNALPQPPSEASMARSHVEMKHKTQESLSLSHRSSSSQAPFTGYEDPLLLHGHDPPNILRHFDSFSDHNKIPHEGESESHSETMALFKVSSSSYELESQNFESRYSDFYSLQPTPQEPLLTNVTTLDHSKTKERIQENIKPSSNSESMKCKEATPEETYEKGVQEAREEFPASNLKFSELGTSDNASEKSELRQDDFLSSLELRSSVKVPTKRRHEEDDEYDEDEDDETRPPRHHTGGKWRPGSRPPPSVGGKWRPATPKTELEEDEEEEMEEDYMEEEEESLMPPPPTYTKGKWLPGKKMTNIIKVGSTVEYHCQPCSRVLKGKEAYERHLKSQLHFVNENKAAGKRKAKTSKEIPPSSRTTRPARSKKMEAKNFLRSCIANLKSRKIVSQDTTIAKHVTRPVTWKGVTGSFPSNKLTPAVTEEEQQQDDEEEVVHKISSGTPKMLCPICKLSFGEAYAALHFASLAHIHNELEERQNKSKEIDPNFNKLILQNISSIVKTSPFFCESCKFYCNLHEDFLAHMNTHTNDPEDDEVKTMFTCSACSGEDAMQLPTLVHHLQTPHHMDNARDLVLQAQQVILTTRILVVCPMDGETFRYRRQYQMHRRIKHQEPGFQVTNKRLLRCSQCEFKTLRKQQIRAHIKKTHEISHGSKDSYHCFICGLSFTTQRKAELHRRSAEHRTTLWRQRGCSVTRTCSLCYEEVDDLPALRRHMSQVHQKDCTPCHLCGAIPPLRSDLAKHQRVCTGSPGDMEGQHKCDLCSFRNDLLAHVLAHKTVAHSERQADGRYACHICKTKLQPSSVKGHMLSHSNEWPHSCHICSRKFSQKDWLEKHLSAVHTCGAHVHSAHSPALCDSCGKTFSNRWHLYRHQLEAHAHASPSLLAKKDPEAPDSPRPASKSDCRPPSQRVLKTKEPPSRPYLCDVCGVQCQTLTSLKTHRQCHKRGEGDKYECPHCNYATGHLPHLRRHLRLHTGATPYSCPYCSYACNNQENLRKHMLKTKRHPGRFMYECLLCKSPQDKPGKQSAAGSSQPLKTELTEHHTTDASAVRPLKPASSSSKSRDPEGSVSRQLKSEFSSSSSSSSSSQPREPQYPQTQSCETSNLGDVDGCHPMGWQPSCRMAVSPNPDSSDQKPQGPHIFCSNYASQFQIHLLEKHKDAFKTKEEVTSHIRSYYHAEQDTTVTSDPLPFLHRKRNSEPKTTRPSGTASASYSSRVAQARRRQEHSALQGDKDDPDDPASEGTEEASEDVLTQIRRSLDIDEFGCDNKAASDAQAKEMETRQSEEDEDREKETGKRDEDLHQDEKSPEPNPSLIEDDAREDGALKATGSSPRRPPPSLRAPSRPAILRSSTPQGEAAQPLRIMIQQLAGDTTVEVDDDGTQQVIIILPDKLGEQPGDVAALLPSLGIASSPNSCGPLSIVQDNDIAQQPLATKDAGDGAVIVQTDQVIALDTQVVSDATIVSGETNVVGQHHTPVVLCSQQQSQQRQHKQVLHSAQVFNPLQVVAEAAEVLTQNELVTRESHQILTAPHQVLAHTSGSQDVLAEAPAARATQIIDAAMFGGASVQHSEVVHATEAQTVLQPDATLSFVDEQVPPGDQAKPDDGKIIYSFTLQ